MSLLSFIILKETPSEIIWNFFFFFLILTCDLTDKDVWEKKCKNSQKSLDSPTNCVTIILESFYLYPVFFLQCQVRVVCCRGSFQWQAKLLLHYILESDRTVNSPCSTLHQGSPHDILEIVCCHTSNLYWIKMLRITCVLMGSWNSFWIFHLIGIML